MSVREVERLNAPEPSTSDPRGFDLLSLFERPSSDLVRRVNADSNTDYKHTRRPTNTRDTVITHAVVIFLSFVVNFLILHAAIILRRCDTALIILHVLWAVKPALLQVGVTIINCHIIQELQVHIIFRLFQCFKLTSTI